MYDELRTQYSVLEAYSAKMDSKVSELEDLLESMEHTQYPRTDSESVIPHVEENEDDAQKLRQENEWLREVIIRSTREDFTNFREDSIKIRSPREHGTILPTVSKSILSPRATVESAPEEEKTDARKSTKMANSFMRKQSSAKIIQKIKSHRSIDPRGVHDVASPTVSATTQTQTSKRPLQAITEIKDNTNNKPESQPEPVRPVNSTNQQTPNNQRSRRSVKNSDEISKAPSALSRSFAQPAPPPSSWNGAGVPISRTTTKYIETNNENQAPVDGGVVNKEDVSTSTVPTGPNSSSKISIPEVVQKMTDLEKVISGKDKAYETEQVELRKQLDEMRHTVVTLVTALSTLTQKLA